MKKFLSVILSAALMLGSCTPLANCVGPANGGENKIVKVGEHKNLIYISCENIPKFMELLKKKYDKNEHSREIKKNRIIPAYNGGVMISSMLIQRAINTKIESSNMSEYQKKAARIASLLAFSAINGLAFSLPKRISDYSHRIKNKLYDAVCVANWEEYNNTNGIKNWKAIYPKLESEYYGTYYPFKYEKDPVGGLLLTLNAIRPEGGPLLSWWLIKTLPSEPNIKSIDPTFTEQGHGIVIVSSTHQHRTDIKIYQQGEPSQEIVHSGHLVLKSLPDNEIQGSTTEKILNAEDFNDKLLDEII